MPTKKEFWNRILADAQTEQEGVYAATFFASRFISIPDQQVRSLNLAYALVASGRVSKTSHVAVVGGGLSGMMCAVGLAMLCDCIVYVFERDNSLLIKFRQAGFRYLHPDLNPHGGANMRYDPHQSTEFPFMNWSGNYAPAVAEELIRKFDHYRRRSNIALFTKMPVTAIRQHTHGKERLVGVTAGLKKTTEYFFDAAILATGFGDERGSPYTNDCSYWNSGNPQTYQPTGLRRGTRKEKILISGTGDSGIMELIHFLVQDFKHEDIFNVLPLNENAPRLSDEFYHAVQNLRYRSILEGSENFPQSAGPISWYWQIRQLSQDNPGQSFIEHKTKTGRREFEVYKAIDSFLSSKTIGELTDPALTAKIEKHIEDPLDNLAGHEIEKLMRGFRMRRIFGSKIQKAFRKSFDVTIIGKGASVYSRGQAPLNWFVLRILESYGQFEYRQAMLDKAKAKGNFIVATLKLTNGRKSSLKCERLLVRYGPDLSVLGYSKIKAKQSASQYLHTEQPLLGWKLASDKSSYQNEFIRKFRTGRWKKAVRARAEFYDRQSEDNEAFLNPDRWLLQVSAPTKRGARTVQRAAGQAYREAKAAAGANKLKRAKAMNALMDMALKRVQADAKTSGDQKI